MSWLRQQRKERSKRQASGVLLAVGLVLGVLAIAPAVASATPPSCTATVDPGAGTVSWSWQHLPDGLEVWANHRVERDGASDWVVVDTDLPGDIVGYGPSGSWGVLTPIPADALDYNLWTEQGDVACTTTTVPPREPALSASAVLDCASTELVVTVLNTGDADGSATVRVNGTDAAVAVAAGATEIWRSPVVVGQDYEVAVVDAATATVVATADLTRSCHEPRPVLDASVVLDCASAQLVVTVANTGDAAGTATVTVNGVPADVPVAAGETATWTAPVQAGQAYDVRVSTAAGTLAQQQFADVCGTPTPALAATLVLDCSDDLLVVTVVNTGDGSGTATVTVNGTATDVTLAAGATETWTAPVGDGESYDVSVTTAGRTLVQQVFADACDDPAPELTATIQLDCTAGHVAVTVTNLGDAGGDATVTVNGAATVLTVAAGQATTWTAPVQAGVTYDIAVSTHNHAIASQRYVDTCTAPAPVITATAAIDCDTTNLVVRLTNTGDAAGSAVVSIDGTTVAVDVPAGDSAEWTIPVTAGSAVSVSVSAGGTTILEQRFEEVCATPTPALTATVELDCNSGRITVLVANSGDAAGEATITVNGNTSVVSVPAGDATVWTQPASAGATYDVMVTAGGTSIATAGYVDACYTPEAEITASVVLDCRRGEVVITLRNIGRAAGQAQVVFDGGETGYTLAAGETRLVRHPVQEDHRHEVVVSVAGSTIASDVLLANCGSPSTTTTGPGGPTTSVPAPPPTAPPASTIVPDCTTNLLLVTIVNEGSTAVDHVLDVNGRASTHLVEAGEEVRVSVPLQEDAAYDVALRAGTTLIASKSFTHNCVDVLNEMETNAFTPMALPHTGANTFALVVAGLSLIGAGTLARSAGSDRRRRLAAG